MGCQHSRGIEGSSSYAVTPVSAASLSVEQLPNGNVHNTTRPILRDVDRLSILSTNSIPSRPSKRPITKPKIPGHNRYSSADDIYGRHCQSGRFDEEARSGSKFPYSSRNLRHDHDSSSSKRDSAVLEDHWENVQNAFGLAPTMLQHILSSPTHGEYASSPTSSGLRDLLDELDASELSAADILRLYNATIPLNRSQSLYEAIGSLLIQKGEPLLAEDILYHAVKKYEDAPLLQLLHARALVQVASTERAISVLERISEDDTGERDGLLARCYKDLAIRSDDTHVRQSNLQRAYELYNGAYLRHGKTSVYTGINSATTAMLLGNETTAAKIAGEIADLCIHQLDALPTGASPSEGYWMYAALGESHLIMKKFDLAIQYYSKAVECAENDWVKVASTRRQCNLLCEHLLDIPMTELGILREAFRLPRVGILVTPDDDVFTLVSVSGMETIQQKIKSIIEQSFVRFGFVMLNTVMDVFFVEAVLAAGGEVYIVLPVPLRIHMKHLAEKFSRQLHLIDSDIPHSTDLSEKNVARRSRSSKIDAMLSVLASQTNERNEDNPSISSSTAVAAIEREERLFSSSSLMQRVEIILQRAARIDIANDLSHEYSKANVQYCALVLNGLAVMRAHTLGSELERIYVSPSSSHGSTQHENYMHNMNNHTTGRYSLALPSRSQSFAVSNALPTPTSTRSSDKYMTRAQTTLMERDRLYNINPGFSTSASTSDDHDIECGGDPESATIPGVVQIGNNDITEPSEQQNDTLHMHKSPKRRSMNDLLSLHDTEPTSNKIDVSQAAPIEHDVLPGVSLIGLVDNRLTSAKFSAAVHLWVQQGMSFRTLFCESMPAASTTEVRSSKKSSYSNKLSSIDKLREIASSTRGLANPASTFANQSNATSMRTQVTMAILFADVVGYSKLHELQVLRFVENFMGAVAKLILSLPQIKRPWVKNTWGDAFYFVFPSVVAAGEFGLSLSDLVTSVDWHRIGLPKSLNIRVSLHAAPVHVVRDPVTETTNFTGVHTSRAARIEPVTPPGSVYCSQAFAAIAEPLSTKFDCNYVGNLPLAKSYGLQPVYHVKWNGTYMSQSAIKMRQIAADAQQEALRVDRAIT